MWWYLNMNAYSGLYHFPCKTWFNKCVQAIYVLNVVPNMLMCEQTLVD